MPDVVIGGLPVVGAVVLVVAVLRRAFGLPGAWAPAASVLVGVAFSFLKLSPSTVDAGLDAFIEGVTIGVIAVGGHSSVKHLLEVLDDRRSG